MIVTLAMLMLQSGTAPPVATTGASPPSAAQSPPVQDPTAQQTEDDSQGRLGDAQQGGAMSW